jgi:DNA helicase IV
VRVRSAEERLLADWMTLRGIRYEYERPYEHNTATASRTQYRPDFFLPEHKVYVEHFGVNRAGATASFVDREKYHAGMAWKRALHTRYGTTLIETFSYERQEQTHREDWQKKFTQAGIPLRELDGWELKELLARGERRNTADLLGRFLVSARENGQDMDAMRRAAQDTPNVRRGLAFLSLYDAVHQRYVALLESRREIDFPDMIIKAAELIERGKHAPGYRRIIVDEFQDISRGRLRLLQAIVRATPDARLMCVGDDWQSIYGFTGSDVSAMVTFPHTFGVTKRTDLDITFRFNAQLLGATSRFVQQNPGQLRKTLRSRTSRSSPAITIVYDRGLDAALEAITRDELFTGRATVLVLGRYNATAPTDMQQIAQRHRSLRLAFLTVHKAKGLEADYVVVLDVTARRLGFPSQVAGDPLLTLALARADELEHAEERRLFYVALTRARHRAFVCTSARAPSAFVLELETVGYAGLVDRLQ